MTFFQYSVMVVVTVIVEVVIVVITIETWEHHKLKYKNFILLLILFSVTVRATHLQSAKSEELINLLLNKDINAFVTKTGELLKSTTEVSTLNHILESVIEECYQQMAGEEIAAYLQAIFNALSTVNALELSLKAQIYFYNKLRQDAEIDPVYLLHVAYYLKQMLQFEDVKNLPENAKSLLKTTIDSLPVVLHNFFFASSFCLRNQLYQSILQCELPVGVSRNVGFCYLEALTEIDNAIWIQNTRERQLIPALETLQFTAQLQNVRNQSLFLDHRQKYQVVSGIMPLINEIKFWLIKFYDNKLIFYQNNFILCATANNGSHRQLVVGFEPNETHTNAVPACQWSVEKC